MKRIVILGAGESGAGAAVLQEVRHGGEGGVEDHLVVDHLEDPVGLVQPLGHRHVGVVDGLQIPDEGLEEVVVGVDEARIDEPICGVDHLVAGVRQVGADLHDLGAVDQDVRVPVDVVLGVAGDDCFRVSNQRGGHRAASLIRVREALRLRKPGRLSGEWNFRWGQRLPLSKASPAAAGAWFFLEKNASSSRVST